MENNYYTPELSDLHLGYECEVKVGEGWEKTNLTDSIQFPHVELRLSQGRLRTPYLTKEQIEAEGWKSKTEYTGKFRFVFEKGNSWLAWNPEENMMTIVPIDPSKEFYEHNVRYAGSCPSINEFRKITKLLRITG